MKPVLRALTIAGLAGALVAGPTTSLYAQGAQGELIKKKAKDLKKQIEGQQGAKASTNAPPGKSKTPPPKGK